MAGTVRLYGVRHHGPGCARSLALALQENPPDILLVEGPPEADALLAWVADPALQPPVALLVYALDDPALASFYPFAAFSPEWQALQYASRRQIPLRFFDLPAGVRLAQRGAELAAQEAQAAVPSGLAEAGPELADGVPAPADAAVRAPDAPGAQDARDAGAGQPELPDPLDPLDHYARLCGFADGESWWDAMIEQRQHGSALFALVLDAMRDLRAATRAMPPEQQIWEDRREAAMRQQIRQAQKEGFMQIAVVCGAWHAPALEKLPPARHDSALLKDLPKYKVAATWVPWNYQRLAAASGYGAGITSPGWYDFLWQQQQADGDIAGQLAERWLTHVARLLRKQDLNASPAEVIDAVRLSTMLAHLNGRGQPGLEEFNQAASAVLCMGDAAPLALIRKEMIVGDRLGQVPEDTPAAPIARDLAAQQKSLRLKPGALEQELDLDLRNQTDLARSHLLHRLNLLDVPWGRQQQVRGKRGSFHEIWRLLWQPEFALALIEAGRHGQSVQEAAQAKTLENILATRELPSLSNLLQQVLLADLPQALSPLLQKLAALAAQSADILHLMDALPPLVASMRYGSVRQIERGLIDEIIAALLARIAIGLPNACLHINQAAAKELIERLGAVNLALNTEQNPAYCATWRDCLQQIGALDAAHPLLLGRCHRLLLDVNCLADDVLAKRLGLALSHPEPEYGADWIEGLLAGSGLLLLNDERLWALLDDWLTQLQEAEFVRVLPLLRRAFSQFAPNERQMLGQRAASASSGLTRVAPEGQPLHLARAAQLVPLARALLGMQMESGMEGGT